MTHSTVRLALAGACLLALTATACGSDDKASSDTGGVIAPAATDATGTGAPTGAAALTISGNSFSAASVTAGTEFTIANNDSVGHTVTDDAGSFDIAVPAGGTATLIIPTAGSYKIHCNIHSSMHGTITVA
ncbi:MAG: cupredoxin domain-containing protein [Ilumatobacteraceae bacterium]